MITIEEVIKSKTVPYDVEDTNLLRNVTIIGPAFQLVLEDQSTLLIACSNNSAYKFMITTVGGRMSTILVLGGGVVGLSMAMLLARQGHSVTVFEHDSELFPPRQRKRGANGKGEGSLSSAYRTICTRPYASSSILICRT